MWVRVQWALYDSREGGFDPEEARFKRGSDGTVVGVEYKATDSGCG